jgi:Bacterial Ig domain
VADKTIQLTHAFSNYSFLDASIPISAGSHAITTFGTGWDNALQKKSFKLTVTGSGGTCSAPGSPGVHVCKPTNGSTVGSPVAVQAAATITGTFARMELWVDGVKKYTETNSKTLTTSISLGAGSHRFGIFAINTAGTKWEGVVTATVK